MKIRPFLILLKFVAITAPLVWWWTHGGLETYHEIFRRLAFPLLQEMGVTHVSAGLVRDRFVGFIPFLGLMLVTPGLALKRRLVGLAVGAFVIFLSHVGLSYWSWVSFGEEGRTGASMARYFPALVMTDAVPFVLWALFANRFLLAQIARVLPGVAIASPPVSADAPAEASSSDPSAGSLPRDG